MVGWKKALNEFNFIGQSPTQGPGCDVVFVCSCGSPFGGSALIFRGFLTALLVGWLDAWVAESE
jgi:hypothetical protein